MADPFSIATATIGLLATTAQLALAIKKFGSDVRDAAKDMDDIYKELSSLELSIQGLRNEGRHPVEYPFPVRRNLVSIIHNCDNVSKEMNDLLIDYSGKGISRRMRWAASGQTRMAKLRSSLEAHKAAFDIALDMTSLALMSSVKTDTSQIKSDTVAIPSIQADVAGLADDVAQLRLRMFDMKVPKSNSYAIERFLAETTTYAESICSEEVNWTRTVDGDCDGVDEMLADHSPWDHAIPSGNQAKVEKPMQETVKAKSFSPDDTPKHSERYTSGIMSASKQRIDPAYSPTEGPTTSDMKPELNVEVLNVELGAIIPSYDDPELLQAVVKHSFQSQMPGDLSIRAGEIITILELTSSAADWWTGKIGDRIGNFPSNYVRIISPQVRRKEIQSQAEKVAKVPKSSPPQAAVTKSSQAVAIFTFDIDVQPGDLSFKKGDVITILEKTQSANDWWTGKIGDRVGTFPSNYVKCTYATERLFQTQSLDHIDMT